MTEAWERQYQIVKIDDTVKQLSFMQAAARLGVGVFASAALKEGALLQDTSLEVGSSVSSVRKLPLNQPSHLACPSHTIVHNTQPVSPLFCLARCCTCCADEHTSHSLQPGLPVTLYRLTVHTCHCRSDMTSSLTCVVAPRAV